MAEDKENISPPTTIESIDLMTVTELKGFLRKHGQPLGGRSKQLKERAKGVLKLKIPSTQTNAQRDTEENQQRQIRRFISPLGETLPHPSSLSGWSDDVSSIPDVSEKDLFNYLVLNKDRTFDNLPLGAVKQLKAKVFYNDGHVHSIKYHTISDQCSHGYVCCKVVPSMPTADVKKHPDYNVWISLTKLTGQVHAADCSCPAGNGESCNHIAGLLYALVDVTCKKASGDMASTSMPCKWNQPRKRKLSPKKAECIDFKKVQTETETNSGYNDYRPAGNKCALDRNEFLRKLSEISPNSGYLKLFPKPEEHISEESIRQCCLPEPIFNYCDHVDLQSDECKTEFDSYISKLTFDAGAVESLTKGQLSNSLWKKARFGRLTASLFGAISKRSSKVKPVSLVKSVMKYYKESSSDAQEWGCSHESKARKSYVKLMTSKGHRDLQVNETGLFILEQHPYIGASPDGIVSCDCEKCDVNGILEIKCPFKYRDVSPQTAAGNSDFCCCVNKDGELNLKTNHPYYYQIQGQMAVTKCLWCDFVVWTPKGISIQRIPFDLDFWKADILPKLKSFFMDHILPEMYSRRIFRGKDC